VSKKLEEKQRRRLEQETRRKQQRREALRRNIITIGVAVIVVVAVVFAIMSERQESDEPVGVAAAQAGCEPVEETEAQGGEHIKEGTPHAPYSSDPPTSGPHYEIPADTGFYRSPLEPERLVHNLEHGQIVIWYSESLEEDQKDQLEEIVEDERIATVATPYTVEGAGYVLTAWLAGEGEADAGTGVLQRCETVSQAAVNEFRADYQGRSPEPLTPLFES
jgi:hypothetical protein